MRPTAKMLGSHQDFAPPNSSCQTQEAALEVLVTPAQLPQQSPLDRNNRLSPPVWRMKLWVLGTVVLALLLGSLVAVMSLLFLKSGVFDSEEKDDPSKPSFLFPHNETFHRELVDQINGNPKATWKAKYNPTAGGPMMDVGLETLLRLFSPNIPKRSSYLEMEAESRSAPTPLPEYYKEVLLQLHQSSQRRIAEIEAEKGGIPRRFDARERWPHCPSLFHVPNQAGCGSCWATASALAISDRVCIASGGAETALLSADDVNSCVNANDGALTAKPAGCMGGSASLAFAYWLRHGLVTGGPHNSSQGCKPYSYAPTCGSPCNIGYYTSPSLDKPCQRACRDGYDKTYEEDLHKASDIYWISAQFFGRKVEMNPKVREDPQAKVLDLSVESDPDVRTVRALQRELMERGPTPFPLKVSVPFQHYRSGVINTLSGEEHLYGHVVRVVGWDETEEEGPHWILTNTWGAEWGERGWLRLSMTFRLQPVIAGVP